MQAGDAEIDKGNFTAIIVQGVYKILLNSKVKVTVRNSPSQLKTTVNAL